MSSSMTQTTKATTTTNTARWARIAGLQLEGSRQMILVVVHTFHEHMHQATVRIISAREATPRERRQYEEAL